MIYIGSDHQGYETKGKIVSFLESAGFDVEDLGPHEYIKTDDYPDYAFAVGEKVADDAAGKGILICGSGIGITIAANKVKGIRAAYVESIEHAVKSREDDDANILVLDNMTFDPSKDFAVIEAWLNTDFTGEERHLRRINKIREYEADR